MDNTEIISIGPEAFIGMDGKVINHRGVNFYRSCGAPVKVDKEGTTSCVKPVQHVSVLHEDFQGATSRVE